MDHRDKTLREELKQGWPNLLGATIGLACGVGMYAPITSMFFRALEQQFHWSKTAAAIALIALPITAICLPFIGRFIDKYGVRTAAGLSSVLLAIMFYYLAQMNGSLSAFYAGFIAFNVLGAATGPISYTRPVAERFMSNRGAAIAIALSGIAVSGLVLPPVLGPLIAQVGWRAGYKVLSTLALVGGLAAVVLIRPALGSQQRGGEDGLSRSQALRTAAFWCLGGAVFCVSAASVGFASQLQSLALESGTTLKQSIMLVVATSVAVLPSRLLAGWALDRFQPESVSASFILVSGIGFATWLGAPGSFVTALAGTLLVGISLGSEHAFLSFFCARRFGLRAYSAIFGALAVFMYVGMAAGGILFAYVNDRTSSYAGALCVAIALMALSSMLFWKLPRTHLATSSG